MNTRILGNVIHFMFLVKTEVEYLKYIQRSKIFLNWLIFGLNYGIEIQLYVFWLKTLFL